jgi:hypothetical protein
MSAPGIDSDERRRIESMLKALPVIQQNQVQVQMAKYRQGLLSRGISAQSLEQACYIFWRTIITSLFASAAPKASPAGLAKAVVVPPPPPSSARKGPAPPPPPGKPSVSARPVHQGLLYQLVDKSNGLVVRLLGGASSLPVGLQDWVNRVFILADQAAVRSKAEEYVTDTIRSFSQNDQLAKTNWISFPLPSARDLAVYESGSFKLRRVPIVIDLEPPAKTQKVQKVSMDFIPISSAKPSKKNGTKRSKLDTEEVEELRRRSERAMKYRDHLVGSTPPAPSPDQSMDQMVNVQYEFGNDEEDVFEKTGQYSVVGTCKTMEKRYLRLTSAPDPALVRPESVLKKWLVELKKLWTTKQKDWKYIEDQMRAIRQDLTVQNLRGSFTRTVYELNARWALETGDLGQFNQCQTQLIQLHEFAEDVNEDIRAEFLCYRLLYYTFQNLRVDEQIFLNKVMKNEEVKMHRFIRFALSVRTALVTSNFSRYFTLSDRARTGDHQLAPSHVYYLMRAFESRQRMMALAVLTRAIATPIMVSWLCEMLKFQGTDECLKFITENGGVMKNESTIDPKASFPLFVDSPLLTSSKLKLMG